MRLKLKKALYVELSTGHMTTHDDELLKNTNCCLYPANYTYGCFITLPKRKTDMNELVDSMTREGFSAALTRLLILLHAQGIRCVQFDSAAEMNPGMYAFDW
jgi:hypothetical protein